MSYTVKLRGKVYTVDSLKAASDLFESKQDRFGKIIRSADVMHDGKIVARISQNGNVWPPQEWHVGMEPLYRAVGVGANSPVTLG